MARTKLAEELELIDEDCFSFCWIVDYPMFEKARFPKTLNHLFSTRIDHHKPEDATCNMIALF